MILSGTLMGLIGVISLLLASIVIALMNKKETGVKSRFLSRVALILFAAAFIGGVTVTLIGGVKPREERGESPPPMASIGVVNEEELKALEKKVAADPKDVKSRERLGHLYLQQQDFKNVFKTAHEALQINPRSAESRVHVGMVFFAMQQLDQSVDQFDQALAIDPKNTEAMLFKGIVQFQGLHDLEAAKKTWGEFMQVAKPDDPGRARVEMFLKMIQSQS